PKPIQKQLATIQQAVPAGVPLGEMQAQGLSAPAWHALTKAWLTGANRAGTNAATAVLVANQQPAIDAKRRVWIVGAVSAAALMAAVEESRLRQGVNDMFRNLARRNQSLLQRQLTVLDGMERRATDPDVLEDLFKMDHLTTRMRRHAEGLIILSGAPPGRGWSAPVKLIDVMRGAISEVEDYARVSVITQSRAALSGSAVTDVIHLLAE